MTGNPDLARAHHQELAAGKLVSVVLEHRGEVVDLGLKRRPGKSEEEDAGVEEALVEDQFAEIPVGHHQNALLRPRNGQDILVGKAVRVVAGDGRNIVAELAEVGNEAKISALVKEEFHTGVAGCCMDLPDGTRNQSGVGGTP
jgi:hypothetical protein